MAARQWAAATDLGSADDDGAALECSSAAKTAALALAHSSPDSKLFAIGKGVLKAIVLHDATTANFLRLFG